MILSVDIETKSATDNREHALIPHLGEITCVGVYGEGVSKVFRDLPEFNTFIQDAIANGAQLIGHNFKFDLKFLSAHGVHIPTAAWHGDTCLMAAASYKKVPEEWLEAYEVKRVEENKKLPHGYSHRNAGRHSLKTLAPYFLSVDPFWENPSKTTDK